MGQGMDDKIRQIAEMLNSGEGQEGIRQLFNSFSRPSTTPAVAGTQNSEEAEPETNFTDTSIQHPTQDSDWILKIQSLLSQVNNVEDSRVNLLRSVHPLLNQTRRMRCTTCINVLKIADILKALTNQNGRLL